MERPIDERIVCVQRAIHERAARGALSGGFQAMRDRLVPPDCTEGENIPADWGAQWKNTWRDSWAQQKRCPERSRER